MIEHPRVIRLAVSDLALAQNWYSQALLKAPVHSSDASVTYVVGFCTLTLTLGPVSGSAGPAIYWGVDDVQAHFERISALPQTGKVSGERVTVAPGTAEVLDPFGNLFGLTFSETQADRLARQQREAELAALQNVRQTIDQFEEQEEKENKISRRVFGLASAALLLLVFLVWGSVLWRGPVRPAETQTTFGAPVK